MRVAASAGLGGGAAAGEADHPGAVSLGPELAEARRKYVEELQDKLLGAVNAKALKWPEAKWVELQKEYDKFNSAF